MNAVQANFSLPVRLHAAVRATTFHLLCSVGVAVLASTFVFGLWYPSPYQELAGGRELFLLVMTADVVCGPLLTLVLFNPAKPRDELLRDLGLVVLIQLGALGYGLWTVWQARPLFLVQEVDRFKVIAAPDLRGSNLAALSVVSPPGWLSGPVVVAIREPVDVKERNTVLFESVQGGRDYAERPEFYLSYEGAAAMKSLLRAKPLATFLQKYPDQAQKAHAIASQAGATPDILRYLPVVARQDWIAVLDEQAVVIGFLKGDGF